MRTQHPRDTSPLAALSPTESARLMAVIREAALSRGRLPLPARPVIGASWDRMLRLGLDPDHGRAPRPLGLDELVRRRRQTPLAEVLPTLRDGLLEAAEAAAHIMIIADAEGRILWIDGHRGVRRQADGIALVEGSHWAEDVAGTSGIGTALAVQSPVRVHSAEHFVSAFHPWSCAAAPVHDPRDGRLLGVIDVSGPAGTAHPTVLSLVTATARWAEGELRLAHSRELEGLRAVAAPLLARIRGKAVVVDRHGWIAGVTGVTPRERRLSLPKAPYDGPVWLPALGACAVEPLPGGHLLRVLDSETPEGGGTAGSWGDLLLDVRHPHRWALTFSGPSGTWTHELSARQAEVLLVLAAHPEGRTAAQLAQDLFGDPTRAVTVRAAMSRLRGRVGAVLAHRPYRIAESVRIAVATPDHPTALLPHSSAPAIARLRRPSL